MKKILCLVMTLMLLALCPAMAETIVEEPVAQTMTSPDGSYSFEVPADYFAMDAEWFASLMGQEEFQQILAQALGLGDASALESYIQLIEVNNMMIVYASDFMANLNVQALPTTLTMEMLEMLKGSMDAAMIQEYATLGIAEEDITLMDIQQIGEHRWYGLQMVMAGMQMQTMITVANGVQYTITFTGLDAEATQQVLESFTVTTVAE